MRIIIAGNGKNRGKAKLIIHIDEVASKEVKFDKVRFRQFLGERRYKTIFVFLFDGGCFENSLDNPKRKIQVLLY